MSSSKNQKKRESQGPIVPKLTKTKISLTALLIVAGWFAIYIISLLGWLGTADQWLLAIIILFAIGYAIRKLDGFQGFFIGVYMMATAKGLSYIDRISKRYRGFWLRLSMWGIILGFGLMAWPLLKGRISKKEYVFGIISLFVIMFFVLPFMEYGIQFIYLPQLQNALASSTVSTSAVITPLSVVTYIIGIVTGFTGYIGALLFYITILNGIRVLQFASTVVAGQPQTQIISSLLPVAAPVIPGITIPLFAGLASLIILLIVHELSHGIISRIYKVRLKSIGLLMIGAIPIGAFVEPDEKEVLKLDHLKKSLIFASGAATNFFAGLVFFVLMLFTSVYLLPGAYSSTPYITSVIAGYPAANVLQPGMQILSWNGHPVNTSAELANASSSERPGVPITIVTNKGTFTLTPVSVNNSTRGYIGIDIGYQVANTLPASIIEFLYSFLVLSFVLNISVAIINLLPVPGFDGWQLYKANIKRNWITKILALIVSLLILINVVFLVLQVSV